MLFSEGSRVCGPLGSRSLSRSPNNVYFHCACFRENVLREVGLIERLEDNAALRLCTVCSGEASFFDTGILAVSDRAGQGSPSVFWLFDGHYLI